jgi:hypothetical protein
MISHTLNADDNDNNEETNHGYSWIMIDLGLCIIPTHFTLRHGTSDFAQWAKTLLFQISKDALRFTPCETSLINDTNSSTATWIVKNLTDDSLGFRYIRVHQKSSRHPVCISGFEVYGQVLSAIDIRSSKCFSDFRVFDVTVRTSNKSEHVWDKKRYSAVQ